MGGPEDCVLDDKTQCQDSAKITYSKLWQLQEGKQNSVDLRDKPGSSLFTCGGQGRPFLGIIVKLKLVQTRILSSKGEKSQVEEASGMLRNPVKWAGSWGARELSAVLNSTVLGPWP